MDTPYHCAVWFLLQDTYGPTKDADSKLSGAPTANDHSSCPAPSRGKEGAASNRQVRDLLKKAANGTLLPQVACGIDPFRRGLFPPKQLAAVDHMARPTYGVTRCILPAYFVPLGPDSS